MAVFRFEAVDARGASVEGMLEAESLQDAVAKLHAQSLTPTKVDDPQGGDAGAASGAVRATARRPGLFSGNRRITSSEKILIVRELATLLRAGITLVSAIESLALSRAGTLAGDGLRRAHRTLNAGEPFVKALEETGIEFPPYVAQLAATGEMTGKLAQALADAAKQMEYDERVSQEMKNSLAYPIISVVAGVAAVLLIFLVVVPKFANLVKGSRAADIPEISLAVIKTGVFLQANWMWLAGIAAIGAMLFYISVRDMAGRTRWLSRLSALPVLGEWLTEAEIGRWATTLGALLANRVPIITALELSAGSFRFARMREKVGFVVREVRGGSTLADAAAKYGLVGATGINLIRVGEKSGELPQTVATLGELSMEAGRNRMKRFLTLIEPMAIVIIGGIIALIMVSIMLAITGLSSGRL